MTLDGHATLTGQKSVRGSLSLVLQHGQAEKKKNIQCVKRVPLSALSYT